MIELADDIAVHLGQKKSCARATPSSPSQVQVARHVLGRVTHLDREVQRRKRAIRHAAASRKERVPKTSGGQERAGEGLSGAHGPTGVRLTGLLRRRASAKFIGKTSQKR